MDVFDYNPTTRVVFGPGSLKQLAELAGAQSVSRALLVSDPQISAAGHVASADSLLQEAGISTAVFLDVEENPTTAHVAAGVAFAREQGPFDMIIAIGGGSVMDCAKGINFLLTNGGRMEDYVGMGKAARPMLPAIGIPTTAGTGSEAQSYALIAKADTHQKMACGDIKARFRVVILDPELAVTAPRNVRAISGMDAISHALESFVCTRRNPVSQMFAKEAWRLLAENYEKMLAEKPDVGAFGKMLLGAHLAGAAIENAMLGAAHACANPLTARFGLTHGIAVGLLLPQVIRFNGEEVGSLYDELAVAAALPQNGSSTHGIADWVRDLYRANEWPERLQNLDVKESDLPKLAKEASSQWTGTFNPRRLSVDDFLSLYREVF